MRPTSAGVAVTLAGLVLAAAPVSADVVHVHTSQRYDRPTALLARDIGRLARPPVDVLTVTEIQEPRRRAVVHRVPGWGAHVGGDVGVMWRADRWRAVAVRTFRVTPRRYVTPGAVAVLLAPRPPHRGPRLLVTVAHLPSGVELGDRFRTGKGPLWRSAVYGWAAHVRAYRHRWHPGAVITAGDWNVNLRRPVWRRAVAAAFPAERLTWRHPLPAAGTHAGGRLIDGSMTTLGGRARLLSGTAASDHRPYRERLSLDAR